jgi:hypothetical protein
MSDFGPIGLEVRWGRFPVEERPHAGRVAGRDPRLRGLDEFLGFPGAAAFSVEDWEPDFEAFADQVHAMTEGAMRAAGGLLLFGPDYQVRFDDDLTLFVSIA